MDTKTEYLYFLAQQQVWLRAQPQATQDLVCNGIGSRANKIFAVFNFKGWLYDLIKPAVDKHDIAYCCGGTPQHEKWADDNLEGELEETASSVFFLVRPLLYRVIDRVMLVIRPLGALAFDYRPEPITIEEYIKGLAK